MKINYMFFEGTIDNNYIYNYDVIIQFIVFLMHEKQYEIEFGK